MDIEESPGNCNCWPAFGAEVPMYGSSTAYGFLIRRNWLTIRIRRVGNIFADTSSQLSPASFCRRVDLLTAPYGGFREHGIRKGIHTAF